MKTRMITHDNGDNRKQNCLFILRPNNTSGVQSLENVVVSSIPVVIAMCCECFRDLGWQFIAAHPACNCSFVSLPLHLSYTILWVVLISPFAIFSREAITIHSHRLDDTTLCRRPYENDFSCRDIEFCCRSRNWHSKAIKFAFIVSIVGFAGAAFYRWCLGRLNFSVWNYWRTSKLPSVQMVWWLPKLFHHITRPPAKLSNFLSFRFDLRFRSNPLQAM